MFWCVNMLKSALSNVSVCERFQTPVDCVGRQSESAEKLPDKVARLCRTLLNSNRGIQCTQKLHVHVDFYTQKKKFENTLNFFTERKALTKPTSKEYRLQLGVHHADSSTTTR